MIHSMYKKSVEMGERRVKKIRKTCRWWPQEGIHKLRLSKENVTSDTKAVCDVPTLLKNKESHTILILPERIYNPITAMGFSAMFTFQLDNTKR